MHVAFIFATANMGAKDWKEQVLRISDPLNLHRTLKQFYDPLNLYPWW
jgi:hypothetical protein